MLTGVVNPSGKLPVTFPARAEDAPSWPYYPGTEEEVRYGEGLAMGYRGHTVPPAFPFGFGLSYASLRLGEASAGATADGYQVTVPVTNVSDRDGREVVQLYARLADDRPFLELKAFATVHVPAGRTVPAVLAVPASRLRTWSGTGWRDPSGPVEARIGTSSADLPIAVLLEALPVVTRLIVKRLLWSVPLLLIASALSFVLLSLASGNPAAVILGPTASAAQLRQLTAQLGLNAPVWVQYWHWLDAALHGNLGTSLIDGQPVTAMLGAQGDDLADAGPRCDAAGQRARRHARRPRRDQGRPSGRVLEVTSVFGFAIPDFVLGLVLIEALAVAARVFPASGFVSFFQSPDAWLKSLVLPWTALGLGVMTIVAVQTRDAIGKRCAARSSGCSRLMAFRAGRCCSSTHCAAPLSRW